MSLRGGFFTTGVACVEGRGGLPYTEISRGRTLTAPDFTAQRHLWQSRLT
ncbi:Hypothetical protein FKW44_020286 [Caligus rogercresseyi]|uniref:Uncharacterized protein n=1 Tax=Caligus rogercresseyi TaxID=217165 RepID=A0A7T8GXQ4_CALRO|nr:Hypothetical protein FKW44_020286 [Caligus rogercresseyi]